MFPIQPKSKAVICLACIAPLLSGLSHSCADEASAVSGQLIATMAQPPHLPDMPHAEFHAQYVAGSLTEVRRVIVSPDFPAMVEFLSTTTGV